MNNNSLKLRLTVMNFLEFAVWGAYLTSMGNYLGRCGMGGEIAWFYALQGIVSIFMPTLMGIVADKYVRPQLLLGICHLVAGASMLGLAYMGATQAVPDKANFIALYTLSVAFYMPTLALSNSVAFTILKNNGLDTVKHFPPIRVFGTVGFIATMWFVNCACLSDSGEFFFTLAKESGKFQYTYWQFAVSGVLGVALFLYCLTLPVCEVVKTSGRKLSEMLGLDAFRLFKQKRMALFFLFSMLLGMSLQVTNGYAGPFITHFIAEPAYADSFAANNATLLVSLSQMAEALCILLIPFFLRRYGIKVVMLIAMVAWVLRFGFFGLGDPAFPGVILFILSCVVYGVAFDFFNVSGGLFVDRECTPDMRASGQGLFMLMTNGLGATIGTLAAGAVIDRFCAWKMVTVGGEENSYLMGDWQYPWFIFSAFALVVAVLFYFLFQEKDKGKAL